MKKLFTAARMKKMCFEILLVYGALCLTLFIVQRNMMYFPDKTRPDPARYDAADMQVVTVTTEDDIALTGWYKPPSSVDKPVIVHYHGNAGNIGDRVWKIRPYLNRGYGVLLAEYRGYGGNAGKPTEQGFYRDAEAWLRWVQEQQKIPPRQIVLYGESLGTGIAVQTVLHQPDVAALVLEAAYTSFADLAQTHYPFLPAWFMVKDRYESLSKIGQIKTPLLMLHGMQDLTVPFAMGKKLFQAAGSPVKFFESYPRAGHNGLYDFDAAAKCTAFIEGLRSSAP